MGSNDIGLNVGQEWSDYRGYPRLPGARKDQVLTGMCLGLTQHLASSVHNIWKTSFCSHVVLHLPNLPQQRMAEIKREGENKTKQKKEKAGSVLK